MKSIVDNNCLMEYVVPVVSIVVPVYKVQDFLDDCLCSLVNQTMRNIEIVLVNDGSPDFCPQICDKWAGLDNRIKVVHQINQGVTKARAKGVGVATGKWILFVDGDDVIPLDSVSKMLECAADVDIVVGQVRFIGPYKWPYPSKNEEYGRDGYVQDYLKRKIHGGPVAKLFRKELFDKFVFDIPSQIKCGEDLVMNLRLARNARLVRVIDYEVYHYIFRENSAVSSDPFVSLKYTMFFNQLVAQSIQTKSLKTQFFLWRNLLVRILDCYKSKVKRLVGR